VPLALPAYVVPIVLIWGEAVTARNQLRGVKDGPHQASRLAAPQTEHPFGCAETPRSPISNDARTAIRALAPTNVSHGA
jgi:hypothetical protein